MRKAIYTALLSVLAVSAAFALGITERAYAPHSFNADNALFPSLKKFDYRVMLGSSYSYSPLLGGSGDLSAIALNNVNYFVNASMALALFVGYEYRPLMTMKRDVLGNELQNQNLLGGARFLWKPSDSTKFSFEYGYTDRSFYGSHIPFYFNNATKRFESLTTEALQNRVTMSFEKRVTDRFAISVYGSGILPH